MKTNTHCFQSENHPTTTCYFKPHDQQITKPAKQGSTSTKTNPIKEPSYPSIQKTTISTGHQRKKRKSQWITLRRKKKALNKMFAIANSAIVQPKQFSSPTPNRPSPFLLFNSPTYKLHDRARFLLTMPLTILSLLPQSLNAHNLSAYSLPPGFKLLLGLG
jgi:hypothetical protein